MMTIEQKMAYLRKALEMGADIDLHFHDFRTQEEAMAAIAALNEVVEQDFYKQSPVEEGSCLRWFKSENDRSLETTIFFDEVKEEELA